MSATLDLVGDNAVTIGDTFAEELWFPDMSDVTFGDLRDRATTAAVDDLFFAFDSATLYVYTASGWVEVADTLDAWKAVLPGENLSTGSFIGQVRRGPNAVDSIDLTIDTANAGSGTLVARAASSVTRQWHQGINVWDVQETSGETVTTLVSGLLEAKADTSR